MRRRSPEIFTSSKRRQRTRSPLPESGSPASPLTCKLPIPNTWTPAELHIELSHVPRLPPLPLHSVHQVYLHKSGAGNKAEEALLYESTSYKPLEFFGDAVVEFQVSRLLRSRLPLSGPGVLTYLRSRLVDNRTLGIIGWAAGLAPHVRFGRGSQFAGDEGRNCPQGIVAEVLEAYIGALAEDKGSNEALTLWFEETFGLDSRVFPSLTKEGLEKESKMAEAVRRKNAGRLQVETTSSATASARFECECADRPSSAKLFAYDDQDHSANLLKGGAYWHTVLTHNGRKLACGRGGKRLDARQEAWASALADSMRILPSSEEGLAQRC